MNCKRAIVDASSAIILYKAGMFGQLVDTYHIAMAPSVLSELTRNGYPGAEYFKTVGRQRAVSVVSAGGLSAGTYPPRLLRLDRGERDTIGCFIDGCADFIIIDDGRGSGFCSDNGLRFINALLFPKVLLLSGRSSTADFREKTARIIQLGRYSQKIIEAGAAMNIGELTFFLP